MDKQPKNKQVKKWWENIRILPYFKINKVKKQKEYQGGIRITFKW